MSADSADKKTLAYQLGEALSAMTDHYLLMTATPHKGDPKNFCRFLELLDRDVYGDVKSLEEVGTDEGHIGDDLVHLDEWLGHRVCIDFYFFRSDEMADYLESAGFEIEEVIERDPYPDVEHQSRRAYIFARKPTVET